MGNLINRKSTAKKTKEDFVILCSPAAERGMMDAIYALYYLPENYKLTILTKASQAAEAAHQEIMAKVDQELLKRRVHFEAETSLLNIAAPRPAADVVVREDSEPECRESIVPHILIAGNTKTPEGLASAILNIALARAV